MVGKCDAQASADEVGAHEQVHHGPRKGEGSCQGQEVYAAQESGIRVVRHVPLPLHEVALVYAMYI